MFGGVWLLCHYGSHDFDVRVEDVDSISFMDLVGDLFDQSIKQDVVLPKMFKMTHKPRSSNVVSEIVDDNTLMMMFSLHKRVDTIEVWLEEIKTACKSFKLAVQLREQQKQKEEERLRELERQREEEIRKEREAEEIARELASQHPPVAIAVPVFDMEKGDWGEYMRIYATEDADEYFPGSSQPPMQTQEQQPQPEAEPLKQQATKAKQPPTKKAAPKKPPPEKSTQTPPAKPPTSKETPSKKPPAKPPTAKQSAPKQTPPQQPKPKHPPPKQQPGQDTSPFSSPLRKSPRARSTPVGPSSQGIKQAGTSTHAGPSSPPLRRSPRVATKKGPQDSAGTSTVAAPKFKVSKTTAKRLGICEAHVGTSGSKKRQRTTSRKGVSEVNETADVVDLSDSDDEDTNWGDGSDDTSSEEVSDLEPEFDPLNPFDAYEMVMDRNFMQTLDPREEGDKEYLNGEVVESATIGSIRLRKWMIFATKVFFMEVITDFCIQEGMALRVEKSDARRFTAMCIMEGCEWKIHATPIKDGMSWAIKTLNDKHGPCQRLEKNPMATSAWLVRHLRDDIRANTSIPIAALKQLCMERFRLDVKERLFYVVKEIALEEIHGKYSESYATLPAYAEMIKSTNPGSSALITWREQRPRDIEPLFKGCFFAFNASLVGFLKGCRPLIGVDGSFLSCKISNYCHPFKLCVV